MPGFSQLKNLSEQILKLGNEINIRAERGEKAVPYLVPDTIPDIDDSQDFLDGMPKKPEPPEEESAVSSDSGTDSDDGSDIGSLLSGISGDIDQPDLSAFDASPAEKNDVKKEEPPPKPKGIDGTGYSGFGFDDDGNLESTASEDSKFDIDALMGGPGKKSAFAEGLTGISELDAILNPQENASPVDDAAPSESAPPMEEFFAPIEEIVPNEGAPSPETGADKMSSDVSGEAVSPTDEFGFQAEDSAPLADTMDLSRPEENAAPLQNDSPQATEQDGDDFFMPDFGKLSDLDDRADSGDADGVSADAQDDFQLSESAGEEVPADEVAADDSSAAETSVLETPEDGNPSSDDAGIDFGDMGIDGLEVEDYASPSPAEPSASPSGDAASKTESAGLDDFGIDGIEIEDYTPADNAAPGANVSVDSIFGESSDGAEDVDLDEEKSEPTVIHKLPSVEDDIAILKPDIFTDNPVTSANPPYYVTSEFGTLPKIQEEEPESSDTPARSASSEDNDFSLDNVEDFEGAPSNDGGSDDFSLDSIGLDDLGMGDDAAALDGSSNFGDGFEVEDFQGTPSQGDFPEPDMSALDAGEKETPAADDHLFDGVEDFQSSENAEAPFSADDIFNTDFNMDSPGADSFSVDAGEVGASDAPPDFGDVSFSMDDDASSGGSLEDFSVPDTDLQLDQAKNDFALDDDFSIPGFSEDDADPYAKKEKGGLDQVDFSGAVTGDGKQRNSLNEEEYKKFKKNLREYPLNVRIAVEDMIVKNEFTDEVTFELIDKILKKVTARQLANYLEKMLDISLPVPRDFEKRTAEEYEAYKASFAYQLKSRILPAFFVGAICAMLLFCIGYLGHHYIYRPLKAESLYKEGYSLLEHDEYPQSEIKFNEALKYKSKKKWFFKYARGYKAHRQYDMAELFYKNILKRFNHDKQAGLEYAQMEVEDLAEYERAEEILKREVLDWHVNDPDGILALGDTYLEWATEKDSSKFDDAFEQYSLFAQLYGEKNPDLYQSRLLRYNIRTDQLHNVLELKEFFFPREKSLSASDWTELSGYLLDKLYGELPRDQEFLRGRIEDLRDMLLFAVKADPENPIASYNLSRYLVEVGDHDKALRSLAETEKLFDKASNLKNRDISKQVDSYRLFGEEYLYDREWLKAREKLLSGIEIFEKRARQTNLEGDRNVGILYYDMGNLEYFISGDLDSAYRNYRNSIENKYDTPSIRYRLGYIDYSKQDYTSALNSFLKIPEYGHLDSHTLLALGNTLSLRDDNFAAQSYYNRLISYLDFQREKYGIVIPQIDASAGDMVETYMKAANNLGVSLFRVARQSGNSSMNAEALVNFQNSIRYYDALTRNKETMVRLPGSNLAEQNLRYATNPISDYDPAIYTEIPRVLDGEKGLVQ